MDHDSAAARVRALDRYRKLLALARDQADAPEGQTALRLARDLAARWGFTAAEMDAAAHTLFDARPPLRRVHLGGPLDNHHRERFRPALLAYLAALAGLDQTLFDARAWVGHLYGAAEQAGAARAVAAEYRELAARLAREYDRYWIPRRFRLPPRAVVAQVWWLGALDGVREAGAAPDPEAATAIVRLVSEGTGPGAGAGWWETPEWARSSPHYKHGRRKGLQVRTQPRK